MNGKAKCKILREIRKKIAEANDITVVTKECTHQGNCKGTCPKCEAEVRYLEQELEKRRRLGKKISVAALSAGLAFLTACGIAGGTAAKEAPELHTPRRSRETMEKENGADIELDGDVLAGAAPDPDPELEWMGEPVEYVELEGDVAYCPEEEDPQ